MRLKHTIRTRRRDINLLRVLKALHLVLQLTDALIRDLLQLIGVLYALVADQLVAYHFYALLDCSVVAAD
jgi:hypothetical protein